ncbi:hypothetical protein [Priestia aryabhattai]
MNFKKVLGSLKENKNSKTSKEYKKQDKVVRKELTFWEDRDSEPQRRVRAFIVGNFCSDRNK